MSDEPKKPWYLQLPAKLTAGVVFLVALTTLVGNLLELDEKRRGREQPAATSAPTSAPPAAPADQAQREIARPEPAAPRRLRIGVDRIAVQHDGSPGTTDWRFVVEADGEALFAFRQDDLDDTIDRNVAVPRDAAASLRVAPEARVRLTVKGWRGSRFRMPGGEPDVTGEGALTGAGGIAPIRVAGSAEQGGAFTFYLSAE